MTDHARIDALNRWNQAAREGTENTIVSSMFEASSNAVAPMESFVTWLLVGAAVVASFLLGNAAKLIPIIGQAGFLACGLLLCASCLFGVLSKLFALLGHVTAVTGKVTKYVVIRLLEQHEEEARKITECATELGVTVDTDVNMERVLTEFQRPLPWWAKLAVARNLKKHAGDPQIAHLARIRYLNAQGVFTLLQVVAFLIFLVTGFIAAAAN